VKGSITSVTAYLKELVISALLKAYIFGFNLLLQPAPGSHKVSLVKTDHSSGQGPIATR